MRINKENIHENKIKCQNTIQITLDDDFNVPDTKADIESIVKEWGNVRIDSAKVNGDRVDVSGCLDFAILYTGLDETLNKIIPVKMSGAMNISESINVSEDCSDTYVICASRLEDLTVKAINSRKLSVKAIITLKIQAEELVDIEVGCELEDVEEADQMKMLTKNLEYSQLAVNMRDNFRIRENVSLPHGKAEIGEILWQDVDIRNLDSRLTDEGIVLNGEIGLFIMYLARDDMYAPQTYETGVAFEGKLDINGCSMDMISALKYNIVSVNIEVKPNYDGENLDLALEVVLDLNVRAYEDRTTKILADIYSPVRDIELTTDNAVVRKLIMKNASKCRASDRIKIKDHNSILQVANCTGSAQIDDITVESDGLQIDGAVIANVFYIAANDSSPMGNIKCVIPFSNKIQLTTSDAMEYEVEPKLEQVSAVMTGGDEIELKVSVLLDAVVFESAQIDVIKDCIIHDFDESEYLKLPAMTGYIARGGETFWDIAKKYHTTTQLIRDGNSNLADRVNDDAKVKKGEKLLLVKAVR